MIPALKTWITDDDRYPVVVGFQLGHDLPPRARDVSLTIEDGGRWRAYGSARTEDRRLGPVCLPRWTLRGELARGATWRDLMDHLKPAILRWLEVGLEPDRAEPVEPELVDWHQPIDGVTT